MKKEVSCGVVVFTKIENNFYALLIHHNLGHWGFPKGHVELGETHEETALREVFEETGVTASIIDGFKEKLTYNPKKNISKDVYFYVGITKDGGLIPQLSEVSEAKFVDVSVVRNTLTFDNEKELYDKAIVFFKEKFLK